MLGLNEIGMLPSISSSIAKPNYNFIRKDVEGNVCTQGVGMYILNFVEINTNIPNTLTIHLTDFDIYVISVY